MGKGIFVYTEPTRDILEEVARERLRQDSEWGGPTHDDQHDGDDWPLFIDKQILAARGDWKNGNVYEYRGRMVKVAALAVAAVEALDRLYPRDMASPQAQVTETSE